MSWLPDDWEAEKGSGWWNRHHLVHTPCGYRSAVAYDLIIDGPFGRAQAREVVFSHTCDT